MATIDFPNNPAVNSVFTAGNSSYKWTGAAWVSNNLGQIAWDAVTNKPATFTPTAHAASHGAGGADAITVAPSQISGTIISSKNANYTLVASDKNSLILVSGTTTITVPASTIPVGTRVDIVNTGIDVITFAGSGGLTIESKDSRVTINKRFAAATLFFTTNTTALLIGEII